MDQEIELISDENGLAVIGEPAAVAQFLAAEGLESRDLGLHRLRPVVAAAGIATQVGAELAANSGRWVKLTEESLAKIGQYGLMKGSLPGQMRGVVQANGGQIKGIVQFTRSSGPLLASPAILVAAAGIMAQIAMQQQMDEIADYLAVIDEKVDDVLRAQKDSALADMIGVDLGIEEAVTIRDHVGRVSDVTWSKVQASSSVIGRTQAYALRQLDALAEKLERKGEVGDVAKTAKVAESAAAEWLAVLAHCFRLQEGIALLELDRVLDSVPEDLEQHRRGLEIARQNRVALISKSTERLIERMAVAAGRANKRVLLNPIDSPAVVRSSNRVISGVIAFHGALGIEGGDQSIEAKRWLHAAGDLRTRVLETGADGFDKGRRFGAGTRDRARSVTNKVATGLAERTAARTEDGEKS